MIANYHTHTFRCKHATGTDREYVEAAIENGLKVLGFSDHNPMLYPNIIKGKMSPEELPGYVRSILALKKEYERDILIHVGLEVEYMPEHFQKQLELFRQFPLEYMILGQHLARDVMAATATEDVALLDSYCSRVNAAIETGLFTYVAHPDVINFKGDPAVYDSYMRALCANARAHGIPLEINFHGLYTERYYPGERFWKIAGEENCSVLFACDAHSPGEFYEIPRLAEQAYRLAERCKLNVVDVIPLKSFAAQTAE